MQANKVASEDRIHLLVDVLVATGWRRCEDGWLPPSGMRGLMMRDLQMNNTGSWSLQNALTLQIQYDQAVVSTASKAA